MNKQNPVGRHTAIDNFIMGLAQTMLDSDICLYAIVVRSEADYRRLEGLYKDDLFGRGQPIFSNNHMKIIDGHVTMTHAETLRPRKIETGK